jgi:glucose/arabinose dehydrogenase
MNTTPPKTLLFIVLASLLLAAPALAQQETGLLLGDDPRVSSAKLTVTQFAAGLNFPSGLVVLPDRSLLVATSRPDGGRYYDSVGELIRLVAADGDSVADGPGQVLATGLPGELTSLAISGDLVAVTSAQWDRESIHFLQLGDDGGYSLTWLGHIGFDFGDVLHQSYGLAFRPGPDDDGVVQLLFSIGSYGDIEVGPDVGLYGLLGGLALPAAIYTVDLTLDGGVLAATELELVATGVRNAMAMGFDADGNLWIADNGINGSTALNYPKSTDSLGMIPAVNIGGEIEEFGYPDTFTVHPSGERIGDRGIEPMVDFLPVDGSESIGPSSLISAPADFPDGLNNGVLVGFHGLFDAAGLENPTNPVLYVDIDTYERFELVSNDSPGIGHINSLATDGSTLYAADLCTASFLVATPCGVIWRIGD